MTARKAYLEALVSLLGPGDILVSGLGANARYLARMIVAAPVFALCDAMGAAIPLALGIALTRPDRYVIALEGDGSLLMSPNVLATVAAARPANLTVLLWVNRHYESSGGQPLPDVAVDWTRRRWRPARPRCSRSRWPSIRASRSRPTRSARTRSGSASPPGWRVGRDDDLRRAAAPALR